MKNISTIATLGFGIALATVPALGQAYSVQPSGAVVQERPTSVLAIPPEDQATKGQLARLFEAMRIRAQMQSMNGAVHALVEGQLRQQMNATSGPDGARLTPQQRAAMDELVTKYVQKAVNMYSADEMLADMATIYQRYLTREDVDAMIAFYGSSAGQHLLDAQPRIMQDFMPLAMQRAQDRTKVLTVEMEKDLAALKQSQKPAPASPPKK